MQNPHDVQKAIHYIQNKLQPQTLPSIGIVLGTGLGDLADSVADAKSLPYEEIPGFPHSTVCSHAGSLTLGTLAGQPVWLQQGRFHLYEGYSPRQVAMGVRVLAGLGVKTLLVTNAAGALNPQFAAGQLMLITDHINFTGQNPLTGENHDAWGDRFPDMSEAYPENLRDVARAAALEQGIDLARGVYVCVPGPCLETPAETRMFRIMGADAIGMSTVVEVIAAVHMGVDVLGISCLTNKNLPDCMAKTTVEDVIATAKGAGAELATLVSAIVEKL